jgi:cytochrome c oxidase assembly protein subunit 15
MKSNRSARPVATWLLVGVAMIIVQIILGGITRLTGSGLSITEWNVLQGSLPPLNNSQWMEAFGDYQKTEQFKQLNSGFSLSDFKFIYFWEYIHRLWGRLIGMVFLVPFIIFLVQRRIRQDLVLPLIILFILGGLQAVIGWIMVASGLTGDAVYVRPTRLGMHFILALILLFYNYWVYLKVVVQKESLVRQPGLRTFTGAVIAVLFLQLFYGALMAGHKAAVISSTWPDMNGEFIPQAVGAQWKSLISVIENPYIVHFLHRMIAYVLVVLVFIWTVKAFRVKGTPAFAKARILPLVAVTIQLCLGILTVYTSTHIRAYKWNNFEWMAQLHQVTALFLLLSLAYVFYLVQQNAKSFRNTLTSI